MRKMAENKKNKWKKLIGQLHAGGDEFETVEVRRNFECSVCGDQEPSLSQV